MMDLDPDTFTAVITAMCRSVHGPSWDGVTDLYAMEAALVAAAPLIVSATADAIADQIRAAFANGDAVGDATWNDGMARAADLARSFGSRVLAAEIEGQQQ